VSVTVNRAVLSCPGPLNVATVCARGGRRWGAGADGLGADAAAEFAAGGADIAAEADPAATGAFWDACWLPPDVPLMMLMMLIRISSPMPRRPRSAPCAGQARAYARGRAPGRVRSAGRGRAAADRRSPAPAGSALSIPRRPNSGAAAGHRGSGYHPGCGLPGSCGGW
jgi:hypothetical protein